jgi:hypothetical protein
MTEDDALKELRIYRIATILLLVAVFGLSKIIADLKTDEDLKAGLDSCLDEIENKCSGLYNYSITLEAENARVVKDLKECLNESR